jgi:hypothetical protein
VTLFDPQCVRLAGCQRLLEVRGWGQLAIRSEEAIEAVEAGGDVRGAEAKGG